MTIQTMTKTATTENTLAIVIGITLSAAMFIGAFSYPSYINDNQSVRYDRPSASPLPSVSLKDLSKEISQLESAFDHTGASQ